MTPRKGKRRRREPRDKRTVLRAEWRYRGRPVVVVEVSRRGVRTVERLVPRYRVDEVSRELAAVWLDEYVPGLTHEERYVLLWQDD